jgi:hypothetical protein
LFAASSVFNYCFVVELLTGEALYISVNVYVVRYTDLKEAAKDSGSEIVISPEKENVLLVQGSEGCREFYVFTMGGSSEYTQKLIDIRGLIKVQFFI